MTKVPPTEMGTDETYAAVLRAVKELGTPIDLVCCLAFKKIHTRENTGPRWL